MNQCVPSWDIDDTSTPPFPRLSPRSHANSTAPDVPMLDYEVAELTWENGQLAMHGLGPPRLPPVKPFSTASPPPSKYTTATTTWVDKLPLNIPRACGTLESIVNQSAATAAVDHHQLVTWFDNHRATPAAVAPAAAPSTTVAMDALVPCRNQNDDPSSTPIIDSLSVPVSRVFSTRVEQATRVGSCSGAGKGTSVAAAATQNEDILFPKKQTSMARVPATPEWTSSRSPSVSGTATFGMDSHHVTLDTKTSDHDSVCHSTPHVQRNGGDEENRKKRSTGKSSISTKRSRAAAIHNQSERKRRDKINQRMKTLLKLVPNSSKTDKASMLDEVIEYLKQLQAQVQMMSRMNMPAMMLPMALQQLQMSMMAPRSMGMGIGMRMGMGMGMGMDMNTIGLPNITGTPPILHPSAFMPMASWDGSGASDRLQAPSAAGMPDPMSAFLACQSQPMSTMDAYSMMAAMYQQFHQPPASSSKS